MKLSQLPGLNTVFYRWTLRSTPGFCAALISQLVLLCLGLASMQAVADDWVVGFAEDEAPISDGGPDEALGIIPELTAELFERLPGASLSMMAGPWVRMQRAVETGQIDGFVTYPSLDRQSYARFSQSPLFFMDIGYLIYRSDHPQRERIEQADSFEDLQGLIFIGQQGAEWERDNMPASLETIHVGNVDTMMHLLVRRRAGDFMVMAPEQAMDIARRLGYEAQIVFHPVRFIPNASIPFHVGLHSGHPEAQEMLARIDAVLRSPEYRLATDQIVARYR